MKRGKRVMKTDEIAALTRNAAADQMIAGLTTFASASRAYDTELLANGFTPPQAFDLLKHWQLALFGQARNK